MGPKLPLDPQMLFCLVNFGRAGPKQVLPICLCATSREAGDADTDDNNFCMSPVYSIQNSFPSIISFDAQWCPCEGGRIGTLICIF